VRLGIFGGTFDPPHVGHLLAASDAFEQLSLDLLVFVPAAVQPLKAGRATAPGVDRLAMVRLTLGSDRRFVADPVEVERDGLSYTVETLRGFAERFPAADRFFLVGSDVLSTFAQWRDPRQVLALATLAVLTRRDEPRPGAHGGASPWDRADASASAVEPVTAELERRMVMVPTRRFDVSSTEIRDRVRCGKSIHGFVMDGVDEYISSHGLYRQGNAC
jgi:nicotinate-nucleotide adenylyltransferase